jgi:hypothetical protein
MAQPPKREDEGLDGVLNEAQRDDPKEQNDE